MQRDGYSAEERAAWDRYAAAVLGPLNTWDMQMGANADGKQLTDIAALTADELLAARRARFGAQPDVVDAILTASTGTLMQSSGVHLDVYAREVYGVERLPREFDEELRLRCLTRHPEGREG